MYGCVSTVCGLKVVWSEKKLGFKGLSDFLWKCFVAKLESFLLVRLHDKSVNFTPWKTRIRMNLDTWLAAILFLGETFFVSSIIAYSPLTISMPPTKICPQCKAAVPVRRKTCERCDLMIQTKSSVLARENSLTMKNCTRPVKERQKLVSELCMGRNKTMRMASMRVTRLTDFYSTHNHNHMHCCAEGLALQCLSFLG